MTTTTHPNTFQPVPTFQPFHSFHPFASVRARRDQRYIMRDQKLQALSNIALFASLTSKHLDMVGRITDRVNVKAGTRLMRQQQVATHMSIIIEGSASVTVDGTQIAVLGPGEIIGELSMVDDQPASATVVTTEHCTVWHIARAGFIPLWQENPEIATPMLQAVVAKLRETNAVACAARS